MCRGWGFVGCLVGDVRKDWRFVVHEVERTRNVGRNALFLCLFLCLLGGFFVGTFCVKNGIGDRNGDRNGDRKQR